MRVAVLIIGLILTVGLFIQAAIIYGLSDAVNQENTAQAGAVGVGMAFMWLFACGLVLPYPRVSMGLFALSSVLGFAASGEYPDLAVWGGIGVLLAVFCYFGYRGKRKAQRKEDERDGMMRQLLAQQAANVPAHSPAWALSPNPRAAARHCVMCSAVLDSGMRFCAECGAPVGASSSLASA